MLPKKSKRGMETVAVLDFETTGLSPDLGDRATEIAIVLVRDDEVVDSFESLMNAGRRIPAYVSRLTGITNEMIAAAPPAAKVMTEAARFVGRKPVVAHNAAFDRRFWEAELDYVSRRSLNTFACTMLISRRIYPNFAEHNLQTLVRKLGLPKARRAHRAMADAEMTSHLWNKIRKDIAKNYGLPYVNHQLLVNLQKVVRAHVPRFLRDRRAQ